MQSMQHTTRPDLRLLALAFLFVFTIHTPRASAHAWMIRHGYTTCATCHVDPSGGSLLTQYGRAQGGLLMTQRWGESDETAVRRGEFLFGTTHLPGTVTLGGDFRGAAMLTSVDGQHVQARALLMQADLAGAVAVGRFRAQASLGFATDGAFAAAIAGGEGARLVSRSHWVGVDLGSERQFLLRVGRINIPYGIRSIEHTLFARRDTHSDVNVSQQHGVALAYTGTKFRGEVMAILGNYQIRPDAYRERGYAGFLEFAPTDRLALGVSSSVTHAAADLTTQNPMLRQAHGGFVRYSPATWLVLSAEGDYVKHDEPSHHTHGMAAYVQADVEPMQGLHFIATAEMRNGDVRALPYSVGGWASVAWFFLPHADVRLDTIIQSIAVPFARVRAEAAVLQLHFYL